MQAAALSLGEISFNSIEEYAVTLDRALSALEADLAVLPAYNSFLLWRQITGFSAGDFASAYAGFRQAAAAGWNSRFLNIHARLANRHRLYLVAGTTLEWEQEKCYHTAYCFDPEGRACLIQRQTHLDRQERELGLSRGEVLEPVPLAGPDKFLLGIIVGCDVRHPETGRILALQGTDIVAHPGALDSQNSRRQVAGMWSQVQQNQFFAVEAQLHAKIAGRYFQAAPAVLAPCEITPGFTGYLVCGTPGQDAVRANLERSRLDEIRKSYPLLRLLNPQAYRPHLIPGDSPAQGTLREGCDGS